MAGSGAPGGWRTHSERISTNTDTDVVTAPSGAGEAVEISELLITVEVAGTTGLLRLEDGAGGAVIASLRDADGQVSHHWGKQHPKRLTAATALNAETTGTAAATFNVTVTYRVI